MKKLALVILLQRILFLGVNSLNASVNQQQHESVNDHHDHDQQYVGDYEIDYWTELHHAANDGDLESVQMILAAQNIAVDAIDQEGFTALHIAAKKGFPNIVQALLASGANVNAQTFNENNSLDYLETALYAITDPGIRSRYMDTAILIQNAMQEN